jgi:hypothetical protein
MEQGTLRRTQDVVNAAVAAMRCGEGCRFGVGRYGSTRTRDSRWIRLPTASEGEAGRGAVGRAGS